MSTILSKILNENEILSYDKLVLYKIISVLKSSDILVQLHNKYLAPIITHDAANNSEYLDFIFTYLECDGHIKEISEKMYVHRNTVHYKIRKIEALLNCSLSKLDVKIYLLLALTDYKMNTGHL